MINIKSRETLIPPPVLPAQAPINISIIRIVLDTCGHKSKFVVENPVVVIIEPTWNAACFNASPIVGKKLRTLKVIIPIVAKITKR